MHYLIYQITNLTNGKIYIGCHKTDNKDDDYMGSGKILKRAIKKHGIENFRKDILFEASSSEEMFSKEKELVVLGPDSYNLKEGGQGGWDYINTKRTKDEQWILSSMAGKIGGKVAGKIVGSKSKLEKFGIFDSKYDNFRSEWARNAFLGKHHTDATKAKIGAANSVRQSGNNNSNYGKQWIKNPITKESKMIFKIDKIPTGWFKGRIRSHRLTEDR